MKILQISNFLMIVFILSSYFSLSTMESKHNGLNDDELCQLDCQDWVNLQCTDDIVQFPLYLLNMSMTLKNMVADNEKLINNKDQSMGLEYSSTYLNLLKEILSIIYKQTKIETAYQYNYQSPDRILRQDKKYIIKNVKKLLVNQLPAEHQLPTTIEGLQGFINIVNFLDVGCAQDNAFLLEILISAFIGKLLESHTDKEWAKQEKLTAQVLENFRNFIHDNYFIAKQIIDLCVEYLCLSRMRVVIKYDIADCMTLEEIKVSQDSQGLTKINLNSRGITSLDGIEILKDQGIQTIDLSSNCIVIIKKNSLAQLLSLEELLCIHNDIYMIETDGLSNPNLKKVSLFGNKLSILQAGIFNGLSTLETLDLGYNNIAEIRTDSFKPLHAMKNVDLEKNKITTIKPGGLANESMTTLILDKNPLSILTAGSFIGLPQLEEISFYDMKIKKIEKNTFVAQDLSSLKKIKFSDCNLGLGEKVATQLQKPIILKGFCSPFKPLALNDTRFITIQSIEGKEFKLSWYAVEMSQTLTNMLEDCPKLIDENASLSLEFSEFQLKLLKKCLKLIHDQLKRDKAEKEYLIVRPDGKYIQKNVIVLLEGILKNMPIKEFVDFIKMIHFLDIGIGKNDEFLVEAVMALFIKFLPSDEISLKNVYDPAGPSLEVMSELRKLIKEKFFVVEPLIDLFIEYYGMYRQKIPYKYSIGDCIILENPQIVIGNSFNKVLALINKGITHLDGIELIPDKTILDDLDLSGNYIKKIPKNCFKKLTHLNCLSLAHNKIEIIEPHSFNSILGALDLSHNHIKIISKNCFAHLIALKYLFLSTNKIDIIEPSCFANGTLQCLGLDDNPLKKLDSFTLAGLPQLSYLNLPTSNDGRSVSLDIKTFTRQDLPNLQEVGISNIANKSVIIQLEKLATQLNRSFEVTDGRSKDLIEPKMVYNLENSLDKCMIQ